MQTAENATSHTYETALEWPGEGPSLTTADERPALITGPPPQFGGRPEWWSPEHLLLSSLNLCLMATFEAMARARKIPVSAYHSRAKGVLSKTPGGLAFTSLELAVTLGTGPEDAERAADTLLKAKQRCIVANALVLPVHLDVTVEPLGAPVPAPAGEVGGA